MEKNGLDEEEIADCVADRLVDEGSYRLEVLLRGSGGGEEGSAADESGGRGGEEDGAVPVGFEVDADVEGGGGVVQVLYSGGDAQDWNVLGRERRRERGIRMQERRGS